MGASPSRNWSLPFLRLADSASSDTPIWNQTRCGDRSGSRKIKTDKPFGVGLLFPSRGAEAEQVAAPPPLPPFLERFVGPEGLAEVPFRSYSHDAAEERLAIATEEGVGVLSLGLGAPESDILKVISLLGSRRAALEAEAAGVDAIVAQGHEAGGHTGRTSTMVLVPQIADSVRLPVIAAGGIADGRGLAAALMLGAVGVLLATREARTMEIHKLG